MSNENSYEETTGPGFSVSGLIRDEMKMEPFEKQVGVEKGTFINTCNNTLPGTSAFNADNDLNKRIGKWTAEAKEQELKKEKAVKLNGGIIDHLCDADFKWLTGERNERAIFWVWSHIRWATYELLELLPPQSIDNQADGLFYSRLSLPFDTGGTNERSKIIISFFEKLSECYTPKISKSVFEKIRWVWAEFIYPVKQIKWLKRQDENTIEWARNYLLNKNEIDNNLQTWFKPSGIDESFLSVMGTVDIWFFTGKKADLFVKRKLLDDMYKAFKQRSRREKNNNFILNSEISIKSKQQLNELVEIHGMKINKFIEKLIDEEYQLYKINPVDYRNEASNKKT